MTLHGLMSLLFVLVSCCAVAAQTPVSQADSEPLPPPEISYTLEPVVVRAAAIEDDETVILSSDLEMIPSATGSITEALKGLSQVQYDYDRQSSLTLGEIAPPRISIFGARPYDNNFMIDGMSISNTLNPSGFNNTALLTNLDVGGADAAMFFDTTLLESITLYSSNVPARYGGFSGGVIDAQLRDPRTERYHYTLAGRYTHDSWFDQRDKDKESSEPNNQPRFSIYDVNMSMEGPLGPSAGVLLSASRRHSTIPLTRVYRDGTVARDHQTRQNDNYHARLTLTPKADLRASFDLTYAPYSEDRWRTLWGEQSDWSLENNAWRVAGNVSADSAYGVLTVTSAYSHNGYSRTGLTNQSYVFMGHPDAAENYRYGGIGDAEVRNKELFMQTDFESGTFDSGRLRWNYTVGLDFSYKHTDLRNESATMTTVRYDLNRTIIQTYDAVDQSGHLAAYSAYAQASLYWGRLLLRPGLRLDRDNYTHNEDVSPRFKAEYDFLSDSSLVWFGGLNRYHGQQLRSYAFKRFRPVTTTTINQPDIVTVTTGADRKYSSEGLDTPYVDELSTGFHGTLPSFDYKIETVRRSYKKQLVSHKDGSEYYMTNHGEGRYEAVMLTLAMPIATDNFGTHRFDLSGTKSRTRMLNATYLSEDAPGLEHRGYGFDYDRVFYNGTYIDRAALPAENFNAPWVLALGISSSFFADRFRIYSITRWRGSAKGLVEDKRFSDDTPYGTTSGSNTVASGLWVNHEGEYSNAYTSGNVSGGSTTDVTVEIDVFKKDFYSLTFIVEALNLFNGNMRTGLNPDGTDTGAIHGRGFYLGARMTF